MRSAAGRLSERIFSLHYPLIAGASEWAGLSEIRRDLLGGVRGRTLEIGAGNGFNLPHYTSAVTQLTLTDPSPHMRRRLRRRLASKPPSAESWDVQDVDAEELPFPDESFDTVVGTYIHCTVARPDRALDEIYRVLRPEGEYLFIEHVRAADRTVTGAMQDWLEPVNRCFGAGCRPNRRTDRTLRGSSLRVERLDHSVMPLAVPTVRPIIIGSARR